MTEPKTRVKVRARDAAPAKTMVEGTREDVSLGRRHIIERPRLTRLLDEAEARVILLVAPAGFGKTTLARQWSSHLQGNVAWYDASPASADVAVLATGIADALAAFDREVARSVVERVRTSRDPDDDAELLAELLRGALSQAPTDSWLVLDDYHQLLGSPSAERLVERLARESHIRVLIASRGRPTWVTPRRILYGEISEVGRSSLAMDANEANEVLAMRSGSALPGLAALAEGWPAVIGLAALSKEISVPDGEVPADLYDFFADEVYRGLSHDARQGIAALAVAPTVNESVASVLLGARASVVVAEAVRVGFLYPRGDAYDFHPLLRNFIRRRIGDPTAGDADAVSRLVRYHVRGREWDEALAVAIDSGANDLAASVIETGYSDLLNNGRVQTLKSWVNRAAHLLPPAVIGLLEAEIAFRRGDRDTALALSDSAASALGSTHPLAARAYITAGRASHFGDSSANALEYSAEALHVARTREDRADALWLRFTAATEVEHPSLVEFLEDFEKNCGDDPSDVVRAACGRLIIDLRFGIEPTAPDQAEAARPLVDHTPEPLIRTSFFNLLGRCLTLRRRYADALGAIFEAEQIAAACRLEVATPHLLLARAVAEIGRGRVAPAKQLLERVRRTAEDPHLLGIERLIRGKALLVEHRFADACVCFREGRNDLSDRATRSELFAYEAFAHACMGEPDDAAQLANTAESGSRTTEPTVMAALARAVGCDTRGATNDGEIARAISLVSTSHHTDLLALAVRAYPRLSEPLSRAEMLPAVRDAVLGPTLHAEPTAVLSRREAEVLELVAEGLTNRQIATRLFISEVTVKVHIRHIFEKLGAKTRTEAARFAPATNHYAATDDRPASRA